ncbi:MAG TPA: SpoIIE family protein phosphatase [Acidobacteriota bacterium]|nr:SpoIIE family protein phosphatase [Acidobacteriota bacterium]
MNDKQSILVVDDELANLQKLKRTFMRDFAVREAKSGEDALALLRNDRFDVIITDQRMPGISGVDLLKESLSTSPQAIRIILTGYADVDNLMDAINEGQVHRYVTKPWEPFTLRQTVLQDLDHWRLKRENQLLAEQLRIAKEVQRQLFPQRLPSLETLDYYGVCHSAREVGGDYYDFLKLNSEDLWMAVGDISGKGISAALLMANLQALLRSRAPLHAASLSDLIHDVNQALFETTGDSKFASLFCGVFNAATRTLRYVNAGHCLPLVVRRDGGSGRSLEALEATGTLVGLFAESRYQQQSVRLEAGDVLLIHTDGVTEAFNSALEEFGDERLRRLVLEHAELPPRELAQRIVDEVNSHTGDPDHRDDLTLVLARVL